MDNYRLVTAKEIQNEFGISNSTYHRILKPIRLLLNFQRKGKKFGYLPPKTANMIRECIKLHYGK